MDQELVVILRALLKDVLGLDNEEDIAEYDYAVFEAAEKIGEIINANN